MNEAMRTICDDAGQPPCRLHGLRMLDPDVFTQFPFASADSTNICARGSKPRTAPSGTTSKPTRRPACSSRDASASIT